MATLSEHATATAFVASNGELAWRLEDIEQAIMAIRDSDFAILGGEVWQIIGPHSWHGMIPQRDGSTPGIHHWETEARHPNELWPEFCRRTAQESLDTVGPMIVTLPHEVPADLVDRLRINVTYVADQKI